jgi:NADH-quinone oxidoreductase subunit N
MYTKDAAEEKELTPLAFYAVAVISILMNLIIGLYPSLILQLLS